MNTYPVSMIELLGKRYTFYFPPCLVESLEEYSQKVDRFYDLNDWNNLSAEQEDELEIFQDKLMDMASDIDYEGYDEEKDEFSTCWDTIVSLMLEGQDLACYL